MNYKPRPGVVMIRVCGVFLLVPTRAASQACPNVRQITPGAGIIWTLFQDNEPDEAAKRFLDFQQKMSKKPIEVLRDKLERFCEGLYEGGYMVRTDEDDP